MTNSLIRLVLVTSLLSACSSEDSAGSGTANITTYGEDFIEVSIPADEVEDGWDIAFDRFLIVLGPVTISGSSQGDGTSLSDTVLFDLTAPGPHTVGTTDDLDAGNWNKIGFDVRPITSGTVVHSSASDADRTAMSDEGYSVYVEGSAVKGDVTKTFGWGFTGSTEYRKCTEVDAAGDDVRQGIQITNGGVADVQLTIHGDHFFYDDLTAENAVLRFDAIAAADEAGDADGEVTLTELDAVQLVDIAEGSYGTGSFSDVNTLGEFVVALTTTLGHFQGEGHCHSHSE